MANRFVTLGLALLFATLLGCATEDDAGTAGSGGTAGAGGSGGTEPPVGVCAPNPCENGGTCDSSSGAALCSCPAGFNGPTCSQETEFKAEFCEMVTGTLNIHWEAVGGPFAPCAAIETTNGVVAEAMDGTAEFQGVSVSDAMCIGMDIYEFTASEDGLTLNGTAFASEVEVQMLFTRFPDEACFVGHWILDDQDYIGHLAAEPFGVLVRP